MCLLMDRSPRLVSHPPLSEPRCPWRRGILALVSHVRLPKDAGGSQGPCPAPHPRCLGPNQCHLQPLQSKTQPVRAQQVAGATQHPGEGRACLPAVDRCSPPKGNQKLVQNRKKAEAWPEPKRRSSGKPLVPCEHSFSGKWGYLGPSARCTPHARQNHSGAFTQLHRVHSFRKTPATHLV